MIDDHCYSIIDAKVIQLDDGKKENLIKIRNPQGHHEWEGDWSDKSELWTKKTKDQVQLVEEDDGTFWIAFKDYLTFFYLTTICYTRDQYKNNIFQDQHDPDNFGMTRFELNEDHTGPFTISLYQLNERFID